MIDTHCHIDLYDSPHEVAAEAEKKRIETIAVTYLPSHYELAKANLGGFKHVHPALGLHPLAARDHPSELALFKKHFANARFIGEVGLDFSQAGRATRTQQEKSFGLVVECLRQTRKFVTVHSRGAEDAVLDYLQTSGVSPVIFHWFSGSQTQLKKILEAGHRISINPAMVATAKWREVINFVPQDLVLTESDGPFVKTNGVPARPWNMDIVLRWLANCWKTDLKSASECVSKNFQSLLAISVA
jgi:TatD DNase family protein